MQKRSPAVGTFVGFAEDLDPVAAPRGPSAKQPIAPEGTAHPILVDLAVVGAAAVPSWEHHLGFECHFEGTARIA